MPGIDLRQRWASHFKNWVGVCSYGLIDDPGSRISALMSGLETEQNPVIFYDAMIHAFRQYIGGMIYNQSDLHGNVFDSILHASRACTAAMYRGEELPLEQVRDLVLPYSGSILEVGSKGAAESYCAFIDLRVQNFGLKLPEILWDNKIDDESLVIVGVASGGLESALLAMDVIGMDRLIALGYDRNNSKVVAPGDGCLSQVNGMHVLVVDDVVQTGATLSAIMSELYEYNPSSITTVSIFDKIDLPLPQGRNLKLLRSNPFVFSYVQSN